MRWLLKAQVALGVWVLISPWVLGAASVTPIRWSNVVVGAAVALTGCWLLFGNERDRV